MSGVDILTGRSPGATFADRAGLAFWRAVRTLLQGVAAAFPAAGTGQAILDATFWESFGYSCLAAGITALVSFIQNVASFLPTDPTQKPA